MIAIIVIAVLAVLIALILAGNYNKFVRLRNTADEAYSTMDVFLKKRFDLIPNLVETVKGYAAHEKETLERVMSARAKVQSAASADEKMAGENALGGTLRSLFAVAENYPELKANQNFLNLQNQLNEVETDIASSRRYYNGAVKAYNTAIQVFPGNIVAGLFNFSPKSMYELADAGERENVEVRF